MRTLPILGALAIAGCTFAGTDDATVSDESELTQPSAEGGDIAAVKTWAKRNTAEGEAAFRASGLGRFSPKRHWAGEIVYSIQVDRFNDGDPTNNGHNLPEVQRRNQGTSDLHGVPEYRHGGDLRGITQRLDYIADLGASALWITPVFKHDGSYHGYCTTDPTEIDPGFGTKEDLRTLVAEAHKRGIRVVLDVVVNHLCENNTRYSKRPDHSRCPRDLDGKYWSGEGGGSGAQGDLAFSESFFKPLKNQLFFSRCGANSFSEMAGTESPAVFGDFVATMFDYDTRNWDFQEIFTEIHKFWIAFADIDGFRVDAAKHVTEDFLAYFSSHIRAYANAIGKPDFYLVGEVAAPDDWMGRRLGGMMSNPRNPDDHGPNIPVAQTARLRTLKDVYLAHPSAKYPGLDAVYDFPASGTSRDVLLNQRGTRSIEDYFSGSGFRTIAAQNDARLNWNVLEIHDWPRFTDQRKDDPFKSRLGLSYLATAQGVPVVYYGMEQGLNGDCHHDAIDVGSARSAVLEVCGRDSHERYRQDMFITGPWRLGSTVREVSSLAHIGKARESRPADPLADPYVNRSHDVFKTARRLLNLRRSCAPLSFGTTAFRWGEQGNEGIFAFSRLDRGREMLVVVNTAPIDRAIPGKIEVDGGINARSGERFKNLLNGFQGARVGVEDGRSFLFFDNIVVPGNSVAVFAHESNVGEFDADLGAHRCK